MSTPALTAAQNPEDSTDEFDERRLEVVSDQASSLRAQIVLTALVIAAIAWPQTPHALVIGWFLLVVVSREIRAYALARMRRQGQVPIALRLRRTIGWNALIGAANGSAAGFMYWTDSTLDAVLTMILVSWGAGAVSTSSTIIPAFIAYAFMVFVPAALMWALQGTWFGAAIATLVVMFFLVQIRFARRNFSVFCESFAIRRENQELASSLTLERTQLALARDDAVRANLDKSRFLAAASHDLRQPLQAMSLNSGELIRLPLEPEAAAISREIASSVDELRSMLDALLDVSKLDAGALIPIPRTIALDRLVERVVATFRPAAAARGLSLTVHTESPTLGRTDPDLFRRVLANLIDNAIKFTDNGSVDIRVTPGGERISVSVTDTGPGIAAGEQVQIFEDLVQIRPPTGVVPRGHGLGLGIVRRLVELLGIDIKLVSTPGEGATFTVWVPVANEGGTGPGAMELPIRHRQLAGLRVLVIDDDPMVRGAFVNALSGLGCQVSAAASLGDAMARLAEFDPQAAVIDWRLGRGQDGFSALAALRQHRPSLAAVIVSADADARLREMARGYGVDVLRKPVGIDDLCEKLSAALAADGHGAEAPIDAPSKQPNDFITSRGRTS